MGDVPYAFLKRLRIRNQVVREFLAEFLGTFILIILNVALTKDDIRPGGSCTDHYPIELMDEVPVLDRTRLAYENAKGLPSQILVKPPADPILVIDRYVYHCVFLHPKLFGDAAFAQTVLEGRKVEDVFAVVWGWGVAVMMGVATCGGVSGGHINPAVTVAFATLGKFPWKKVGHYLLAQHLGAFVASAVLFVNYKDALDYFDPNRTITGDTATAYIWATYPKPYVSLLNCFFDQIVGTGLLMFTVLACIDRKNLDLPKWSHPIILGFMISALAMCFGANCMAPLNPARDFATRCFTAVAGYGLEVFTHRNYWWVGLLGPHVGAIIGGWIYYLGIELHIPDTPEDEKYGERHELTVALNSANDRKSAI